MRVQSSSFIALATATLIAIGSIPAYAVRNGVYGGGRLESVYLVTNDPIGSAIGTATNVKYSRCMVTAAHIARFAPSSYNKVYQGNNLNVIDNKVNKHQAIAKAKQFEPYKTIADSDTLNFKKLAMVDAGVLWLEGKAISGAKLWDGDYEPLDLGKVETMGDLEDPIPWVDHSAAFESPFAPFGILLEGYGEDGSGEEASYRKRRTGSPKAVAFFKDMLANGAKNGTAIRTAQSAADMNRIGCGGDSGGPLSMGEGDKVFGVLSTAVLTDPEGAASCANTKGNDYTAFDDVYAGDSGKTNWTRINELVEEICGKMLETGTMGAPGTVVGSLTPEHEFTPGGVSNNFAIDCGGDCTEFMHEDQSITLTAVPDDCVEFDHWSDPASTPPSCPCDGSTSPTCGIGYGSVGTYGAESIDHSTCIAVFREAECSSSSSSSSSSTPSTSSSSVSSSESSSSGASSSISTSAGPI